MLRLNPLTLKKIRRFKSIKRGYYAFIIFAIMIFVSLFAELLINKRAIIVHYQGKYYLPTYSAIIPGTEFGFDYAYETNYRQLAARFKAEKNGNWILMPPVPYDAFENDLKENKYPPFRPSFDEKHYMGTDTVGRDLVARLVYGFRIAIFFSLALLASTYVIGISIGCAMGFWGGMFDLVFQRIIEIWSNIPVLYVIIIIASIISPTFTILLLIMVLFGWTSMTWTMRTITYKEKSREYVRAAKAMGASNYRIIFKHIIPNTIAIIVTFAPFAVSGGIVLITSLDYLGFGLQPPTPSWGDLLAQGWANMEAWWIASSVGAAMTITLITVTFVGEAVREAFDPKLHTTYE